MVYQTLSYGIMNSLLAEMRGVQFTMRGFNLPWGGSKYNNKKLTPGSKYHMENWTRGQNIICKLTRGQFTMGIKIPYDNGLFVNDFLLARQIQVLAQAGENFCVHPGKLCLAFSYFAFFFVTIVSWSPSGPCNFLLLLVDLKNCVRLCWLRISRPSILSPSNVSPGSVGDQSIGKPDWA